MNPYQNHYPVYYTPYMLVPVNPLQYQQQIVSRQYPDVTTKKFQESSQAYQNLINDSQIISQRFAESGNLRRKVMRAAQKSDHNTVVHLIQNTGISHPIEVSYNPDSIKVTIMDIEESPTSKLIMALRW
ncbi:hypothetical protein [Pontibacillus marinus]|uniref:Inner spore coat protein n=1 Tax=Pontibacillus marinus BH030004 = DSM 16465 TaxID=1385511 RepID=A0A0A5G9J1_9BACI|nr:hypothetical protein [Pontibacillus marinus]KGX89821.1 hypothetical protein N783_04240 [Pontibacillus marinus BH030004 = DSM 16465]